MSSLTLADGTQIDMTTGRPVKQDRALPGFVTVPTHAEARKEVTRVRRRIADLPDVPEKMNIISVVAAYYMFGLDDHEIAHALGCTTGQVVNIKMTEAFGSMIDALTNSVVNGQADNVRQMLSDGARKAADTMLNAMDSENEQIAVVAAKDILDRAGHRPADVVEHRHKVEGGLTIEYVRKGRDDTMPVLDMKAINEGDE